MTPKLIEHLETIYDLNFILLEELKDSINSYTVDDDGNLKALLINKIDLSSLEFFLDFPIDLAQIELLDINSCKLVDIIPISKMTKLRYLSLNSNLIQDLRPLSLLENLLTLKVKENKIQDLSCLSNLKKLEYLNLNSNQIIDISALSHLVNLKSLNLGFNQIQNISPLKKLKNISSLNLERTQIEDFSPILSCKKLKILDISFNSILDINQLSALSNLTDLDAYKANLTDLTPLKKLTQLQKLVLGENNLTDIEPLRYFKQLRYLSISGNKIADFSPLSELNQLEILFIDDNGEADYESLKNLSVRNLSLENNKISDITFIKKMDNLRSIWLSGNDIYDISPFRGCQNMHTIDLRSNPLKILPAWILDLDLNIKWNDDISGDLILYDNPIVEPPIQIIKQGNEAIKRYFLKLKEQGVDYIFEAKLTLVGEGGAGKTSLQKRLLNPKSALPSKASRTRGIKIHDWTFKSTGKSKHVAHIWDFGGQDVYYPVHRFFLTENSVFVLLASSRQTTHDFDYWIPTIYQFGDKSPIILGQTCDRGLRVVWNDIDNFVSNPNFNIIKTQSVPYFELNLPNKNEGLTKMKKTIIDQIVNLPHYGKGVPKSWIEVRGLMALEAEDNACIPFDTFEKLCYRNNPHDFKNLYDVHDCAKFLHSIGVLLWYFNIERLSDWVILRPEWAVNAVYQIIDDVTIHKRNGSILPEDFDRLWSESIYLGKHSILKKMLEVFKIAFPKKHQNTSYLIPARLLSIPQSEIWANNEQYLRIYYKYIFMPKGIVNQVSAELSRYILNENSVWNNAVNLTNELGTASCQMVEDFYERKITISAKGKDARGLIMIIMNCLKDIGEEYKGLKPEIFVPCICIKCQTKSKQSVFTYTDLLRWFQEKEEKKVTCNESGETHFIEDLLYNVGLPSPNNKEKEKKVNKIIKIFLASSSELETDRSEFEIFINRENKRLIKQQMFIELNVWEDFIDAMSPTRLQDEYNKEVVKSDIFITLMFTKMGKYTQEEFEKAHSEFIANGKPFIYTFVKNANIKTSEIKERDILSKLAFEKRLNDLEHYPTKYSNIEDLKLKFKVQLDKIIEKI